MLKMYKLTHTAKEPTRGSRLATGYDLSADEEKVISPGHAAAVGTGLRLDVTEASSSLDVQVRSRSGMALKHSVFVLNSPGTIDQDYQGELKVILMNLGDEPYVIRKGDRIAQLVMGMAMHLPILVKPFTEDTADKIKPTERGTGGFGSTGK
jgi:dUTP pyrophosphatase